MNRIEELFKRKPHRVLSIFCTAGFPQLDSLPKILRSLQDDGIDMVEIGMPFSDPTADGPVIQHTNDIAIGNGMSLEVLFDQLKDIRKTIDIPLVLMGYFNPVMQYGIERFLSDCKAAGIDGTIIPDLPLEEYLDDYAAKFDQHGIRNIFLVTPQTPEERVRRIDEVSDAFIYIVSTFSITGGALAMAEFQKEYFTRVKNLQLKNPCIVGFGIRDRQTFDFACSYLNGAIIGTAFLQAIENAGDTDSAIRNFVQPIRD